MSTTTWRELLTDALDGQGESFADIVASTLTPEEMDVKFDDGFGGTEGIPFTVWTKKRVYFPTNYDGAEGVESVSRAPNGEPTQHVGGG